MKILVLGGTVFLGRYIVESALKQGHRVTLFNRGKTNADLFPDVEKLRGDRSGDIGPLREKSWDAVIDTSGYQPAIVKASVDALAGIHYTFISTLSVYRDWGASIDETAALAVGTEYGPLKAQCEQAGAPLIIRPGLIVGPQDPSDRFTYWPARVRRGGAILAPGRFGRKIQYIDVRDLAEWTVRLVEKRTEGVFNAVTPPGMLTMGQFLDECGGGSLVWMEDAKLVAMNLKPYVDLPLWIPGVDDLFSATRALGAGLTFRPLRETIADTLQWDDSRPPGPRRAGLDAAREAEMIKP